MVAPMRGLFALLTVLALTGCGRPLTEAETAYLADIHGDSLDTSAVRIVANPVVGIGTLSYPARPQVTCRERIVPPPDGPRIETRVAGIVLFNTFHVRPEYALPDFAAATDGQRSLVGAMFFAHEMTHVWQWQNRELTGYHPFRAFAEHAQSEDPYLFNPDDDRRFLDFGYEVQASLVEEYVCCRAVDPRGARTARLERLIGQVMPVTPLQSRADTVTELRPWAGADLRGVCS
jgi:hypothetical protein